MLIGSQNGYNTHTGTPINMIAENNAEKSAKSNHSERGHGSANTVQNWKTDRAGLRGILLWMSRTKKERKLWGDRPIKSKKRKRNERKQRKRERKAKYEEHCSLYTKKKTEERPASRDSTPQDPDLTRITERLREEGVRNKTTSIQHECSGARSPRNFFSPLPRSLPFSGDSPRHSTRSNFSGANEQPY